MNRIKSKDAMVFRLYNGNDEWYVMRMLTRTSPEERIATFVNEEDARTFYDIVTSRAVVVYEDQFNKLYRQLKNGR